MPVKDFWRFYVVYPWDLTRRELDEMATEVIDGKEQELANELFAEITHDENDNAVEYTISYVNECNTNDEPVSKPVISYPTYDLPDDWMAVENQKIRAKSENMATPTTLPPVSSSSPVNGGGVLTIIRLKQHTSNNESRACAGCRERRWGCPERI